MERYLTKILFICTLTGALLSSCRGRDDDAENVSSSEVSYTADDAKFPNPERGFYKYASSNLGTNPAMLGENTLRSYRAANITLVYRIFYLKSFRNKELSPEALNQIDADMATLRSSGMKCVMRFAYSSEANEPDAPLDIIFRHLEQLKPVLAKNVDVIAVMQAGFIGAWGEWYYSSNQLKTDAIRAAILDRILDALPATRMTQVRTPAYKTDYLQNLAPLAHNEAYSGTKAARVGHHNDCFLASANDVGTYRNVDVQKAYINADALYVPVGGETCPPDGIAPADCQKAEQEMQNLHWSFLNDDYYNGVNDRWKTQGCMDNIIRNLGYRFSLLSAKYTDKIAPGGTLKVEMKINNTGYAAPYNPRKVEVILKNRETLQIYLAGTKENPGFWTPQSVTEVSFNLGIPKDMPEGEYDLYLNLPDPEPALYRRPEYSIRLANKNVWDAETGYNKLLQQIGIGKYPSITYSGDTYFQAK
jgi:hypothetical protein